MEVETPHTAFLLLGVVKIEGERIAGMKVLTDVQNEIVSFEALEKAYRCARKGKRYRQDVMEFTNDLESNLIDLQNLLIWQTYKVGPYRQFYVSEPKKRLVMSLQFPDRVVQWAIYNVLNPFYDRMFIEDSYACRNGKGSHKAADRLEYLIRQVLRKPGQWDYLKLDVSKFFYRVSHDDLEAILMRRILDEWLMWLLSAIINCEETRFGLPAGYAPEDCPEDMWLYEVGMPIGNLTSQLFANIYMNELDQYCKHVLGAHYYIRYMDDVIILHDDKRQLAAWRDEISDFLEANLHLSLNAKTAIRPVESGIDFVGYRMYGTHRKLKHKTAYRMIRHTKALVSLLNEGRIDRAELDRVIASYNGILEHCDSHGLSAKIAEVLAEAEKGETHG